MKRHLTLPLLVGALGALATGCRGSSADPPSAARVASLTTPPGFRVEVFVEGVANARSLALSPTGTLFVGTRKAGKVYAIRDAVGSARRGEAAQAPIVVASGLDSPNGVAFEDGTLYVAEVSRVIAFDQVESRMGERPAPFRVVRDDYPEDQHHGWKYIAIGPDGWLYVPVGAPCNLCQSEAPIHASITRMTLDGKQREIWARGVRNSVGFDWHPQTKALWFTENGSDNLGDDFPGDELDVAPRAGLHFGYPHCHNGDRRDEDHGAGADCSQGGPYAWPTQVLGAHVAALGMKFYTGAMFPAAYRGRVFIAEHGSWNRSAKVGYRVTMVTLEGDRAVAYEPFVTGWLGADGEVWGRPVDVLELPDGSLLVSDDLGGVIYRVSHTGH